MIVFSIFAVAVVLSLILIPFSIITMRYIFKFYLNRTKLEIDKYLDAQLESYKPLFGYTEPDITTIK